MNGDRPLSIPVILGTPRKGRMGAHAAQTHGCPACGNVEFRRPSSSR
jgi:hypothetical protein